MWRNDTQGFHVSHTDLFQILLIYTVLGMHNFYILSGEDFILYSVYWINLNIFIYILVKIEDSASFVSRESSFSAIECLQNGCAVNNINFWFLAREFIFVTVDLCKFNGIFHIVYKKMSYLFISCKILNVFDKTHRHCLYTLYWIIPERDSFRSVILLCIVDCGIPSIFPWTTQ